MTASIMTEAEKLMSLEPADLTAYMTEVDAAMMRIFEACAFQDLTGQRVTKFASALGVTDTEQQETAGEVRARELLLNGPAMNGPTTSQDDIDALFS